MADTTKYEAYRVLQPRTSQRGLFHSGSDEALRAGSLREAVEIGRESKTQWLAGQPQEIDNGIAFQIGYREVIENYTHDGGVFHEKQDPLIKVTDVFIDYPTGIMLIREKDRSTPSPFLASQAFRSWLKSANEQRQTGFDSLVQAIPLVEDFLAALRNAASIKRLSFVVHGPNPADEDDIVEMLSVFTQEHGIQSTSVQLNSEGIASDTAERIAASAGKLGDSVSATIEEKGGSTARTIRMKRKARSLPGPRHPSPKDGRTLLDRLKKLLDNLKAGN